MTKVIVSAVILVFLVIAAKVFEEFTRSRQPRFEYRRKDVVSGIHGQTERSASEYT